MNTNQVPCRYFNTAQGCRNGSECDFPHNEQIQQKQRPQQRQEQRLQQRKPTVLCKFFPNCHKGSLCTFLHPQEKQEPESVSASASVKQEKTNKDEKQFKESNTDSPCAKEDNKLIRYCYFYKSIKGCRNGDTCEFAHQD